jgi:hypothetical protein
VAGTKANARKTAVRVFVSLGVGRVAHILHRLACEPISRLREGQPVTYGVISKATPEL